MLNLFASITLAAGEEASGTDLLIPAIEELIAGIIAFAIVFFVIWKLAGPALKQILENRQKAITGQLEAAESDKAEAASLLEDYRSQLATARSDANRIIDEARQAAEELRAETVAKAKAEAEEIVTKARTDAQGERERALQEARSDMATLSLDLAERVVRNSLDRDLQRDLVETYLADLDRMAQ